MESLEFMREREKCDAGFLYNTQTPEREELHICCMELCYAYNHIHPSDKAGREEILRKLFGKVGAAPYVEPTIFCGFGFNIEAGDRLFVNSDCVFVDPGKIIFGNDVMIGPQCGFYTALHALDARLRIDGFEAAYPIHVGDNVWFGGHVTVLPGVTIGENAVIGAGSVVTRDIPANMLAAGNPCRVIRPITEADRFRYQTVEYPAHFAYMQ